MFALLFLKPFNITQYISLKLLYKRNKNFTNVTVIPRIRDKKFDEITFVLLFLLFGCNRKYKTIFQLRFYLYLFNAVIRSNIAYVYAESSSQNHYFSLIFFSYLWETNQILRFEKFVRNNSLNNSK